jgi:plasmid stability protein
MRAAIASHIVTRTTIDLDPSVLRELRARGAREGKSMGQLASELLAGALAEGPAAAPPFAWTAKRMGALVDLEDDEAVRRAMDEA